MELSELRILCEDVAWALRQEPPQSVDSLAHALHELRQAKQAIGDAERDVEARLAESMETKEMAVEGLALERRWSAARTEWSHEVIAKRVAAASRDERILNEATGEIEGESEAAARVVLSAAGIGYWRKGRLKELGIDPKDVCTPSEEGRYTVRVSPMAP